MNGVRGCAWTVGRGTEIWNVHGGDDATDDW